jgi:hypothetical protein
MFILATAPYFAYRQEVGYIGLNEAIKFTLHELPSVQNVGCIHK